MFFKSQHILAISALGLQVLALNLPQGSELRGGKRSIEERDGVVHTIFEHDATGSSIDFVTNSGICETTPGVNQYSGYFSVGRRSPYTNAKYGDLPKFVRKHEHVVLVL